ncbi:transcriptional regulator [Komagataeibacter xylinus]|uniref:Transcriptional regulator n=2 Tax=Komagataeibacter xylinus TaxID=28448 RepID=A0A318PQW6_KOMXY|nr:LuxR C-terminal-related transcriptional regulator [Komagataeibacter xylinus]AZV38955.1 transcriptional regulator [Komagataeibacter xylinus]PYD55873.1 transcriptional regulator [Komagataeibacter xylinus]GBQ73111.1 LuxR family transcriptional regulator [Komagataeibacter xylinus NBRC 15237]
MNRDLMDNSTLDTLEAMLRTRTIEELAQQFHKAVDAIGEFYCLLANVNKFQPGAIRPTLSSYPKEWTTHYIGNNYGQVDPLLPRAMQTTVGFEWNTCDAMMNKKEWALAADIYEIGVQDGFVLPIHGPGSSVFFASFGQAGRTMPLRMQIALSMLTMQYHQRYQQLTAPQVIQPDILTARERECLAWVANGRTTSEVAEILNVNDNTIKFHLKNAQRKLECTNRVTTVIKALSLGLISI